MFGFLKSAPAAPRVTPAEALAQVAAGKALLLDVREPDEVRATGKVAGAHNLPLGGLAQTANPASGQFDKRLAAAKKDGLALFVYCASGARSGRAADILRAHGFAEIHNLGGLGHMQAAGARIQR